MLTHSALGCFMFVLRTSKRPILRNEPHTSTTRLCALEIDLTRQFLGGDSPSSSHLTYVMSDHSRRNSFRHREKAPSSSYVAPDVDEQVSELHVDSLFVIV